MTNKEAIKVLENHISPYDDCKADNEANQAIRLAVKALENSSWIPTSEMLPDKYGCYLVMWRSLTEDFTDELFYEICEYIPEEDEWERIEQAGKSGAEIVAWMPLPEPYTKEETT